MGRRMGYCQLASSGPEIWYLEQACAMTLSGRSLQNLIWHLTPELSRAALRPWAGENLQHLHEAAKRARLERIVRTHAGPVLRIAAPSVSMRQPCL